MKTCGRGAARWRHDFLHMILSAIPLSTTLLPPPAQTSCRELNELGAPLFSLVETEISSCLCRRDSGAAFCPALRGGFAKELLFSPSDRAIESIFEVAVCSESPARNLGAMRDGEDHKATGHGVLSDSFSNQNKAQASAVPNLLATRTIASNCLRLQGKTNGVYQVVEGSESNLAAPSRRGFFRKRIQEFRHSAISAQLANAQNPVTGTPLKQVCEAEEKPQTIPEASKAEQSRGHPRTRKPDKDLSLHESVRKETSAQQHLTFRSRGEMSPECDSISATSNEGVQDDNSTAGLNATLQELLTKAGTMKEKGNMLFKRGRYEEAVIQYEIAKKLVEAEFNRLENRTVESSACLKFMIACSLNTAASLIEAGDHIRAIRHCSEVLERDENNHKGNATLPHSALFIAGLYCL
jgi:tetratricopeptide (TPR) repeat protein